MMTFAIRRLKEGVRATLIAHFRALPISDLWQRFGTWLAPELIAAYVDGIDFTRDAVFGLHDDHLVLVGLAHLACEDDAAEVGLSVLPAHRGRGVGSALFRRAVAHAHFRCIPKLLMQFLPGNAPILRIARRFGMDIVTVAGESSARLELPLASSAGCVTREAGKWRAAKQ
jgi:GNAT superfamily N-acetyltransferase